MTLISGMMTCSSFYVTAFPIGPLLGVLSYSIRGEEVGSWENFHLYHEVPVSSSIWWSRGSGKEAPRQKGIWDMRHPGGGLTGRSWAGWLLGLVPLGLLDWAGWLGEPSMGPCYPQDHL